MKRLLWAIIIATTGLTLGAQEVLFPQAILSGGGSAYEEGAVVISRWRLSQINVLTIPDDLIDALEDQDELIKLYPNPVKTMLFVDFQLSDKREYIIWITDILGRNLLIPEQGISLPELKLELDLSKLQPAVYLLHVEFPLRNESKVFPIQKI